jgi:hypothetical protein
MNITSLDEPVITLRNNMHNVTMPEKYFRGFVQCRSAFEYPQNSFLGLLILI